MMFIMPMPPTNGVTAATAPNVLVSPSMVLLSVSASCRVSKLSKLSNLSLSLPAESCLGCLVRRVSATKALAVPAMVCSCRHTQLQHPRKIWFRLHQEYCGAGDGTGGRPRPGVD